MNDVIATRNEIIEYYKSADGVPPEEIESEMETPRDAAGAVWDAVITRGNKFSYQDKVYDAICVNEPPEEFVKRHFNGFSPEELDHLSTLFKRAFNDIQEEIDNGERPEPNTFDEKGY